jgi:formylglycine-generating enzyme
MAIGAATLAWAALAQAADYARVPGGRFESVLPQGDQPGVSVPVTLATFDLRRTPVSVADYLAFVRANPQWRRGAAPAVFADAGYFAQ